VNLYAKPYSEACEQNKEPILAVLRAVFNEPGLILEIGAGTGQHAVHFARELPHLDWQPTDRADYLPGIQLWIAEAGLPNLRQPLELDTCREPWPITRAAGVFSANTTHIMHWSAVEGLFRGIGRTLQSGEAFCLYGPFNYGGRYTSASNAAFDASLKQRDPASGIRDVDDLDRLARENGLQLRQDYPMPANNRTLVWVRD
jgi:SAM-dependent methyltransferase